MNRTAASSQQRVSLVERLRAHPDAVIAAGLALLTMLTRLPFQSHFLYHWDSVNFAYSLVHFDVAAGQPHVPGYILYVLLGQIVNALVGDHQTTLVLISIVSSGLTAAVLYALGRDMFGRATGVAAAVLLASSPLFWFYGEIALPHTLDTLMVTLSAWLLYRVMRGERRLVWIATIVLGVTGGLRPQTLLFFGPLILLAGRRLDLKRIVGGVIVLGVTCLLWFIPLIATSGGLTQYLAVMRDFTADFNTTTSLFSGAGTFGLGRNLRKLSMYSLYAWAAALLPAGLYFLYRLRQGRWGTLLRSERFWFLTVWAAPTVLFYVVVHMGQQGLVFVYLPVLLLASAEGLRRLLARARARRFAGAVAVLAALNAAVFLLAPTYPLGKDSFKLLTRQTLQEQDAYLGSRFDFIRERYPPEHAAVMAANWRHVQYYLPEYARVPYDIVAAWEVGAGQPDPDQGAQDLTAARIGVEPDADGAITVILFDPEIVPFVHDAASILNAHDLPDGEALHTLQVGAGQTLRISPEGISLADTGA